MAFNILMIPEVVRRGQGQLFVSRWSMTFQETFVYVFARLRREAVLCEKDLSGDAGKKGGSAG